MNKIIARFEMSLKAADPIMIPQSLLQNADLAFTSTAQNLEVYRSSGSEGYLDNANNQLDVIVTQLPVLEKRPNTKTQEAAAQIVAEVRKTAEQELAGLKIEIHALGTQLASAERKAAEIREEIERKSQSFGSEMQRFSQRYEEEEDQRRKIHKETLTELATDAATAMQRLESMVTDAVGKAAVALESVIDEQQLKAKEALASLESDKLAAQHLVGIVGETGMISGWNKAANSARTEARLWNGVALVSLVFAGWEGIQILAPAAKGDLPISWEGLLSRTVLLAVVGLVAGFAGKQASRANRAEEANRRYELQLASIGPFIAELDSEAKQTIKTKLVERMYGQNPESSLDIADTAPVTAGQMLVDFVKQIPAIIKASK
jgi:hypothetical protein